VETWCGRGHFRIETEVIDSGFENLQLEDHTCEPQSALKFGRRVGDGKELWVCELYLLLIVSSLESQPNVDDGVCQADNTG